MWAQPKYSEKRSNWETSEAKKQQFEKFLPIKLYCVIPTKQRQKDKSQLPTFIYNWTRSRRMKQVPSVTHAALAAGRMKYSNYSRLPHIMTGLQKLTCNRGGEMKKIKFRGLCFVLYCCWRAWIDLTKCYSQGEKENRPKQVRGRQKLLIYLLFLEKLEERRRQGRKEEKKREEGWEGGREREEKRWKEKASSNLISLESLSLWLRPRCCSILLHVNRALFWWGGEMELLIQTLLIRAAELCDMVSGSSP